MTEVKNVAQQGWTSQLRDYSAIAGDKGLTFNLYVRENTIAGPSLANAERLGLVNVLRELPKR